MALSSKLPLKDLPPIITKVKHTVVLPLFLFSLCLYLSLSFSISVSFAHFLIFLCFLKVSPSIPETYSGPYFFLISLCLFHSLSVSFAHFLIFPYFLKVSPSIPETFSGPSYLPLVCHLSADYPFFLFLSNYFRLCIFHSYFFYAFSLSRLSLSGCHFLSDRERQTEKDRER